MTLSSSSEIRLQDSGSEAANPEVDEVVSRDLVRFECRGGYHFSIISLRGVRGTVAVPCSYSKCKKGKVKPVHHFDLMTGTLERSIYPDSADPTDILTAGMSSSGA